jgi:hypothetical protein
MAKSKGCFEFDCKQKRGTAMTDTMMHSAQDPAPWPLRSFGFAFLGGLTGLAVWKLTEGGTTKSATQIGMTLFVITGALGFGYTLERGRAISSAIFALIAGAIMGFVVYWNTTPDGGKDGGHGEAWQVFCAAVTIALAVPLFMAWRASSDKRSISYVLAHDRAWISTMLWFASAAFTGLTYALAHLLAELFQLIGINVLSDLLSKDWFSAALLGTALGGAIGLLREREKVLSTLQRVVMTVLAVLAPAFGAGLVLFLLSMIFTGLAPLWETTTQTTPILLACVAGALLLANTVIGDTPEEEAKHPALRYAAMALAITILPLAIIAAISTGFRIQQYGLTPDRLWAVVFTAIATAYGLIYLVSLVRGRMSWTAHIRPGNTRMAVALCLIAFVLAMPFISFGALSTRDQLARLKDGRTPVEKFDWMAMRFDFGPSGQEAVKQLAKSGATPAIRTAAASYVTRSSRYEGESNTAVVLATQITVLPRPVRLPDQLREDLIKNSMCANGQSCTVFFREGDREAIITNGRWTDVYGIDNNRWTPRSRMDEERGVATKEEMKAEPITIREVKQRQVFVGDKAIGRPFK